MRILYIGEEGHGNLEWCMKRGFESLGCAVDFVDINYTAIERLRHWKKRTLPLRIFLRIAAPALSRSVTSRLLGETSQSRYDMVFCHKNALVPAEVVRRLADIVGARLFCYYPDNPLDSDRSHGNRNTKALIPRVDCYFTYAKYMMDGIKQAGAPRVEYLPFAYDRDLRHPVELSASDRAKYGSQVAFVGNYTPDRAEWFRHLMDFDLGVWGNHWGKARKLDIRFEKVIKGPAQFGESFCKIYSAADIGLNIVQASQGGDGHNMRTFEAMACGGFVMCNRTQELVRMFREDKEIVCFSSAEELRTKARFYSEHPQERKAIERAGYEKIRDETYHKRCGRVLEVFKELQEVPLCL